MSRYLLLLVALSAAMLAWSRADATSEYHYAAGEDGVIDGGMAPNGRRSLAAHGEGDAVERVVTLLSSELTALLDDVDGAVVLFAAQRCGHGAGARS